MKRRDFLTTLTAASSATLLTGCARSEAGPASDRFGRTLPTRPLGRTGERVSMLGLGGFHAGWTKERDAEELIEAAMAGGIRFFDTAESYQQGESERRYGKFLVPKYRESVFLMTKSTARDARTARAHLEGSLARLKTDVIDLWQIHSLESPEDVDVRLNNGVLDVFLEAQASGRVRHIGFTGHRNPEAHLRMLERTTDADPFAACQMPVNVIDPSRDSFVNQVTPVLQRRNIALLAMKTLADGRFFAQKKRLDRIEWTTQDPAVPGRLSVRDALHFAWSLPIAVLITGAENASLVREKVDLARAYEGMSVAEQKALIARAADLAGEGVEYYKRPLPAAG